ncbi:MAG: hypothetical protein J7J98_02520 [candidate division Zixibacteria bacterium]|nr:hypothetical protein [candidate division Zixibacteria bacterium]
MTRYELQTPITSTQSRKRKLESSTSMLLVSIEQEDDIQTVLSEYIFKARADSKRLVAQTIVCYDSVKKVSRVLDQTDLQYWFDSDVVQAIGKPQNVIISCESQRDVLLALAGINTEAMVFYNLPLKDGQPVINEAIVSCSIDGYQEHIFLRHQDEVGCFVFYQDTHDSIELLAVCRRTSVS